MYTDSLIVEPVVCSLQINYPELSVQSDPRQSEGARIAQALRVLASLKPDFPLFIYGCAHGVVAPGSVDGGSGSLCNLREDGGCDGRIVLAPSNKTTHSKWVTLSFKLAKGQGDQGWLTLAWNPTTIVAGDNVHPASLPNAETGELIRWPSSARDTLTPFLRLGFLLLEGLFQQASGTTKPLFEPSTRDRIRQGAMHVVRSQFCGYLPTPDVPRCLQGLTLLYSQTIASGRGIINLAKLQGLVFDQPYTAPGSNEVTYFKLVKLQGKKPAISAVFYDKEARLRGMRQRKGLPASKEATVNQNVRLDITLHSLGVKEVVRQARRRLKLLMKVDPTISTRFAGERFLAGPPESTVWALERAIRILSHVDRREKIVRLSFGAWLIPYVLRDILRLDVITGFTVENYERFLRSNDPVAVAWRAAKPADTNDPDDLIGKKWAGDHSRGQGGCLPANSLQSPQTLARALRRRHQVAERLLLLRTVLLAQQRHLWQGPGHARRPFCTRRRKVVASSRQGGPGFRPIAD